MVEQKRKVRFWEWVGKISAVVFIVWTVIQILNHFVTKEYSITAQGSHSHWEIPEALQRQLYLLRPSDVEYDFRYVRSIWYFNLSNEGAKEVKDLRLELPFEGFYRLRRPGEEPTFSEYNRNVHIGFLRPSNDVYVTVWSTSSSELFYEKDTKITHPDGIIAISYPVKVRGLLAWIVSRLDSWIFAIGFGVAIFMLVFCIVELILNIKERRMDETRSGPENQNDS